MPSVSRSHPLRRTQPPVVSSASARQIGYGVRALRDPAAAQAQLRHALARRFAADAVILTDSGTSALVLALRAAVPNGGTVALPGYGCVDLMAAAAAAGLRVRLYDVDPGTLSPDCSSVEQALRRGAEAVIVAYLYGYPADITGVAALAAEYGAAVIEDAAQAAGGSLEGVPLGGYGPMTVLSFGRGKGISGGGGGALLARGAAAGDEALRTTASQLSPRSTIAGWRVVGTTAAQWVLGRPALYGIPSAIPFLRLGETVYHPASTPSAITPVSAAIANEALDQIDANVLARESVAAKITAQADPEGTGIATIRGGRSGYLRLPVRRAHREPAPRLGILRGYPSTLAEYVEVRHLLHPGEFGGTGAVELRDTLFTIPTHHHVREADIDQIGVWLRGGSS